MSRTVIFDFDGTLADTWAIVLKLYNQEAARFKADPIAAEETPKLQELGYLRAIRSKRVSWWVIPQMVMHIFRRLKDEVDEVKAFAGMVECAEALHKKGYRLGVLTSNNEDVVKKFFATHKFPEFDFVVSTSVVFGKSKALKRIIKQHNLTPTQTVYVGDELRDVVACRRAGIKVIGVSWGLAGDKGFERSRPDQLVHSAAELQKVLLAE